LLLENYADKAEPMFGTSPGGGAAKSLKII